MVVSSRDGISPSRVVGCDALERCCRRARVGPSRAGQHCRSLAGLLVSTPPEVHVRAHDRRLVAVARSLGWAEEAAARGDYADALSWVGVVEAIGDLIPIKYRTKRQAWLTALVENGRETRPCDDRLEIRGDLAWLVIADSGETWQDSRHALSTSDLRSGDCGRGNRTHQEMDAGRLHANPSTHNGIGKHDQSHHCPAPACGGFAWRRCRGLAQIP